jgi:hypothetical protein
VALPVASGLSSMHSGVACDVPPRFQSTGTGIRVTAVLRRVWERLPVLLRLVVLAVLVVFVLAVAVLAITIVVVTEIAWRIVRFVVVDVVWLLLICLAKLVSCGKMQLSQRSSTDKYPRSCWLDLLFNSNRYAHVNCDVCCILTFCFCYYPNPNPALLLR